MSDAMDVHMCEFSIGTVSAIGTTIGLFLPKKGGAITLLSAHVVGEAAAGGTINALQLNTFTDGATPSLLGTLGTANAAALIPARNVRKVIDLSTAYVQPGTVDVWLGCTWTSGTILADTRIVISYVMGM
jgi:hypothetical protein